MSEAVGKKDSKNKIRLDLVPTEAIEGLALALMDGIKKYDENNWRLGLPYSEIYGAAQRHLQKFWNMDKPDVDSESKLPHLYHAICNIAFLITYEENKECYQTFDDRPGGDNEFYRKQEKLVQNITELVQNYPSFFDCGVGDGRTWAGRLQKVYDTLDYAIHTTDDGIADEPDFPDLTKMSHPEACEHLEVGMKVKVLCSCVTNREDWKAGWMEEMDEFVGTEAVISEINVCPNDGVVLVGDDDSWYFPAFVLEIISRPDQDLTTSDEVSGGDSSCTKDWKDR